MGGNPATLGAVRLGIDVGTSNTAAALYGRDQQIRPVLFDGAPLLPSAVFADGGTILVGTDALQAAAARPALLEPNPKRCIDDTVVLLGEQEVPVESLLAAILRRVRDTAEQAAGSIDSVTLTYPVAWGPRRLATLTGAAQLAGLPTPRTIHEPISAAAHFVGLPDVDLSEGQFALVYDFGAGTFDATLIRRTVGGFDVAASQGLPDAGGLDIDAAIVASISAHLGSAEAWGYLHNPGTPTDLRNRRVLMHGVRAAKETLSRTATTSIYIPVLDTEVPFGREQFESLARPVLDRTVAASRAVLRDAGVAERDVMAIFLVGGSTRIPLVSTLLHRAFGRPPVLLDQPELAVAYGSVMDPDRHPVPPIPSTLPASPAQSVQSAQSVQTARPARPEPPALPVPSVSPAAPALPVPSVSSAPDAASAPVRRSTRWFPRWARGRRWAVAGLGAVLVAATGLAYLIADNSGREPEAGQSPASNRQSPLATVTPSGPAATSAPPTATPVIPDGFVGRWSGIVQQPGGVVTSWNVTVTFTSGSKTGTFRSASLGCSGTLTVVAPRPTASEMHLRQRTTRNPRSICVPAANWTLIVAAGDGIDMFWQQVGNPNNVATATLVKS